MYEKIKLEKPDGSWEWGYATTEHIKCVRGLPVVVVGGLYCSPSDLNEQEIVLSIDDDEVRGALVRGGYDFRRAHTHFQMQLLLPRNMVEKLDLLARDRTLSREALIEDVLREYLLHKEHI